MPEPHLRCDFEVLAGRLRVAARFELSAPWTCLFGASGSGKTTILRALAGFVRPRTGSIHLGERVLSGSNPRVWVPPHRRPIRTALQQPWLFPGTVRDNLLYGQTGSTGQTEEVAERLELGALLRADIRTLSGGQRQRVSLARTVASALAALEPIELLLLDEPFTGLDLATRNRLAVELRTWMAELHIPVLSVTHDVPETLLLHAEVIRLHEGAVLAQGPATEVLAPERATILRSLS